jgi:hypothetical protein
MSADRVSAMRGRVHVTPEWKARVRQLFERDLSAKAVASAAGIAANTASRWAHALGFRMMYVTDQERRLLIERREMRP